MGERIKNQRLTVPCTATFEETGDVDRRFGRGTLRICYPGENANRYVIDKAVIEKRKDTAFNTPIVCHYIPDDDAIGSHDSKYVKTDNGWRKQAITEPVGVVPESANIYWETVEDTDGNKEYLCADALIWKRQKAYRKIKDNISTAQSMEITILDGEMIDGYMHVYDFEFTAFCLLGEGVQPCFESAALVMFSKDEFAAQYAELLNELKDSVNAAAGSGAEPTTAVFQKKGVQEMDTNKDGAQFSLTASQETEELSRAVHECAVYTTPWDEEEQKYRYIDHDSTKREVYCFDFEQGIMAALTYATEGDTVTVDAASARRVKIAFEPFGTDDTSDESIDTSAEDNLMENVGEFALRIERHKAQRAEDEAEVFAKFDDIKETEEFSKLVEHTAEFSIDELEEKCFAIRGRHMSDKPSEQAPAKAEFALRAPVGAAAKPRHKINRDELREQAEPYGGLFARYGNR